MRGAARIVLMGTLAACSASRTTPPGLTLVEETFVDDQGTSGRFRAFLPKEMEGYGALLFFTWDGGGRFYKKEASLHVDLAAAHKLVMVSMANPDRPPGNRCWWAPEVEAYSHFVEQFIEERLAGVDRQRIFTTGLSGGSDFAAAFHYHTEYRYGGGAVALCGGDVPRADGGDCKTEANPPAAAPVAIPAEALLSARYDFAIPATDPLLPASLAGAAFYRDAGFAFVRHRVVAGDGHCGFADGFEGLGALAEGLDFVDPPR